MEELADQAVARSPEDLSQLSAGVPPLTSPAKQQLQVPQPVSITNGQQKTEPSWPPIDTTERTCEDEALQKEKDESSICQIPCREEAGRQALIEAEEAPGTTSEIMIAYSSSMWFYSSLQ